MKLSELQKRLQTNFTVIKKGHNFQQTITRVKIKQPVQNDFSPGVLHLEQLQSDIVCQAGAASLIIKNCSDLIGICNQINAALLAEANIINELLALNFKKDDLDQFLKLVRKKFQLEILVCDLNNSIIGSTDIFPKTTGKSLLNHKHMVKISNQTVQMGCFYWRLTTTSSLVTDAILQTLSQVLCQKLLDQQLVSVLNSPTEVMLVRLLKSQQVANVEEYFIKARHPLPKQLAFIYLLGIRPDQIGYLKRLVQRRFTDYFGFAISSVYQGQLISLVKMPLPLFFQKETRDFLQSQAQQLHVQFLVTNPVSRITELRTVHEAATLIMKEQLLTKQVNFCADAALPLLVKQNFDLVLTNYILNPVPRFLANYDQTHETHLLRVLESYLANDCSTLQTANALYLHRNSVTNRLRKIERLTGINYHKFKQLQSLQLAVSVYQILQNKN